MTLALEPDAPTQSPYEVRFDWAEQGLRSIAQGAGVIVVVDAISVATDLALAVVAADFGVPVLSASLRNRTAVARWILRRQESLGERLRVAVVAAGERRTDGSVRMGVEDLLAAGAVVEALAGVGIDHSSPEAAAAAAAFAGLRNGLRHLLIASVTGQQMIRADARSDAELAARVDDSEVVPVLVDGAFVTG